jgi:hypothetical protein
MYVIYALLNFDEELEMFYCENSKTTFSVFSNLY